MMDTHDDDAYQTLVEFLYRAPIGLVQCDMQGEIDMLNPMSSQLLMPVVPDGDLSNLFDVFDGIAPQLRGMAAGFERGSGVVCEALRVQVNSALETGIDARHAPQVLADVRAQEGVRAEADVVAGAGDEAAAHLLGGDAVGQPGGEEGAAADADVAVEAGQVDAVERLVERAQRAQFVHAADGTAAGDRQPDLQRAARAMLLALAGRME